MKRITDINELKKGDKIVSFFCGQVCFYTFLCVHPNNDKYVLLIDDLTKDAPKFYINNLIENEWYTDYTLNEINKKKIEYHERMIERLKERINK